MAVAYVRTVKTASGATAVQIVYLKVDKTGKAMPVKNLGAPNDEDGDVRSLRPGSAFYQNDLLVVLPDNPSPDYFPYYALAISAK